MIFYVLLFSVWLMSCQPSATPSPVDLVIVNSQESEMNCGLPWDQGGQLQPRSLPEPEVQKTFFGKKIDISKLKQVFDLSAQSTTEAIRLSGVDVYQLSGLQVQNSLKAKQQNCQTLNGLPEASESLQEEWAVQDPSGLKNLGLFLPSWKSELRHSKKPIILVKSSTDRWTLVHEYVHYLFYEQREKNHQYDREFIPRFRKAYARFENIEPKYLEKGNDETSKLEQIRTWIDVTEKFSDLFLNYTLEEIAVESLLKYYYGQNDLLNVSERSYGVALKYISSSSKKAMEQIDLRLEEASKTKRHLLILQNNGVSVVSELKRVHSLTTTFQKWKEEVRYLNEVL